MKSSGVISLTTDFGHKGPFSGVMKGVILERFPAARIVDLGHEIPAHWPPEAGFWLHRSYRYFPAGTVHLAIVDPGVGTDRRILVVVHDEHIFLAPDNGLLDPILNDVSSDSIFGIDPPALEQLGIRSPSLTFHGRDIFAPIAAELAAGRLQPSALGAPVADWTPGWIEPPTLDLPGRLTGQIVTIDTFGNLISNIDAKLLDEMQAPVVHLGGHQFAMRSTYGRAAPGDYLALINSFDVIEVARAEGSAADGLGVERGAPVVVTNES